jgi:hypothetical protein
MIQRIKVNLSGPTDRPDFKKAKSINLFSQETPDDPYMSLATQYKGIVDALNPSVIFNITGPDYKIVQHDDVWDSVVESLSQKGLNTMIKPIDMNNGGRLRLEIVFPDVKIKIGDATSEDIVTLQIAVDNSYDASTGVRCTVEALELDEKRLIVPNDLAYFYGRHTKNMDLSNVPRNINDGLQRFQTNLQLRWNKYFQQKLDTSKVKTFLEDCLTNKTLKGDVAQKYLEKLINRSKEGKNQWELYKTIASVMHESDEKGMPSLDVQEKAMRALDSKINNNITKLI